MIFSLQNFMSPQIGIYHGAHIDVSDFDEFVGKAISIQLALDSGGIREAVLYAVHIESQKSQLSMIEHQQAVVIRVIAHISQP